MKRELLDPAELDQGLVSLWNAFRQADPVYRSPFYSPRFTQAVGQLRRDARVAIIEQDGEIVGFFPFHLVGGSIGKPIGGQINDYHGPIMAPGSAITPAQLLDAAGLAAYDFNHLPVAMGSLAAGARIFSASPQMDLSQGYDACIAAKDDSWSRAHSTMRRKWRKTEREIGPLRFTFHDPSDETFARHTALKNAQLAEMSGNMQFATGWEGEVIGIIRRTQEPDFAGIMSTLHAGDRLIAAHFGMRSADMWHWWFPSYDLSLGNLSPGMSLLDQCAQAAFAHGLTTIDFGRGGERYKQTFADRHEPLCEGSFARSGSLAAGTRWAARGLSALGSSLPLGRYSSLPQRALARLVFGISLPAQPTLAISK